MKVSKTKPEWVPEDADEAFASWVIKGKKALAEERGDQPPSPKKRMSKRRQFTISEYVQGILENNRTMLGRAITLIESNAATHLEQAQELLKRLLPYTGNSIRIGVSGIPGSGKSTLIGALGLYLIEQGHKVAVLAIDPTSSISGGSILGDKTRMEKLTNHPRSFIRPSPTRGALGGVARKTRESMLLCEAAGYDVILVETVGVGQSEIAVRSMVDFFLLVLIPGGGDELQGIKKGIMEITDAVVINKADGPHKELAMQAQQEYSQALHYLSPATKGWQTRAFICSAFTGEGIPELWQVIKKFKEITHKSGFFQERRRHQSREWMYAIVEDYLKNFFLQHPDVQKILPEMERAVMEGKIPATTAAKKLLENLKKSL